jgi:type IV pilus assembly protein PilX
MMRRHASFARSSTRQRGATLVVVLILLLLMTLLGLASLRGTVLEERMTANLLDRGMAFQVAEAGLREAEALLDPQPGFPGSGCNNGLCGTPDPAATERWLETPGPWRIGTAVDANMDPPQFFIEDMGLGVNWPKCDALPENKRSPQCETPRFRVTSRSAQDGRASVILQAMFAGK